MFECERIITNFTIMLHEPQNCLFVKCLKYAHCAWEIKVAFNFWFSIKKDSRCYKLMFPTTLRTI